jgi:hypothetical protein
LVLEFVVKTSTDISVVSTKMLVADGALKTEIFFFMALVIIAIFAYILIFH